MAEVVGGSHFRYVTRELARGRIVLAASGTDTAQIGFGGSRGKTFGKHPHEVALLQRVAGCAIAAHNIVIKDALQLPSLGFRHFGEMGASVEALLFPGYGQKDQSYGKLVLAEDSRTLEGHGR